MYTSACRVHCCQARSSQSNRVIPVIRPAATQRIRKHMSSNTMPTIMQAGHTLPGMNHARRTCANIDETEAITVLCRNMVTGHGVRKLWQVYTEQGARSKPIGGPPVPAHLTTSRTGRLLQHAVQISWNGFTCRVLCSCITHCRFLCMQGTP